MQKIKVVLWVVLVGFIIAAIFYFKDSLPAGLGIGGLLAFLIFGGTSSDNRSGRSGLGIGQDSGASARSASAGSAAIGEAKTNLGQASGKLDEHGKGTEDRNSEYQREIDESRTIFQTSTENRDGRQKESTDGS